MEKTNFVAAYNNFKQKYLENNIKEKLSDNDRNITKVYFDLMKEIPNNYKKTYTLSLLLIEANRNFGWSEFDPSHDAKTISAIQSIKNWSSNNNKLLLAIGDYISEAPEEEIDEDDLYIWLNEIGIPIKEMPFNQKKTLAWLEEKENEVERDSKQLVCNIKCIWNNPYYQKKSSLINEPTFTHDILPSIINFISPGFLKHWNQAQSLSATERGAQKFGDVIGYVTGSNKNLYELFFVEVSYRPFHQDPEPHINEDKKKLGKLELWNVREYLSYIFYSLNSLDDSEVVFNNNSSKATIKTFTSPSRIPQKTFRILNFKNSG
ncbi:hypothetical protein C2G38_2163038 [Gigaspora rosea]|uniref:Uncharacterized protein n=1 Tax=Gigaspora rosea TaxID=44941 RepID=A0A397W2P1_9GLOM|nr:hypothetical protein C2G38_2163038 [Gigaspora rosea]CAG8515765.1 17808_t:CDS:2 [Gigaspora rosea]